MLFDDTGESGQIHGLGQVWLRPLFGFSDDNALWQNAECILQREHAEAVFPGAEELIAHLKGNYTKVYMNLARKACYPLKDWLRLRQRNKRHPYLG